MSIEQTREILTVYWRDHDPRYVADDAVFTMMQTGEEIRGREAIARHLDHFYHHVPLCVTYELEGDRNQRARIYLQTDVLLRQLLTRETAGSAT